MPIQKKCPLHNFELEVSALRILREIKTHYCKPFLKAEIFKLYSKHPKGFIT